MAVGILILAVVTAQVWSSSRTKRPDAELAGPAPVPIAGEVTLDDLARRLALIEALLTAGPTGQSRAAVGSRDNA
jgi:hypothetical protein